MWTAIRKNGISKRLMFLYLLNVSDWFCTVVLLKSGYFAEANPFMANIIGNTALGFAVKCLLPLLVILFVCTRAVQATEKQYRISKYILNFAIGVYTLINLSHVLNYVLLFTLL